MVEGRGLMRDWLLCGIVCGLNRVGVGVVGKGAIKCGVGAMSRLDPATLGNSSMFCSNSSKLELSILAFLF